MKICCLSRALHTSKALKDLLASVAFLASG